MSNLFSELSTLWSSKAEARARRARRERSLAAFRVLHDINWSAPWQQDDEPERPHACMAD